ncbi:MAG TPA: hypothetical protein VH560_05545 [Polyangia bacterium]|jgi:hypothetical protein|nr:hypothetical protein [Polyangia bacterium]
MRRGRVALLVELLGLLGACASKSAPMATDAGADARAVFDGGVLQSMAFTHPTIRDIDVLFVIDDAPGMARAQGKLIAALPAFTDTLKNLPAGYPNLQVGIISADLGSGEDQSLGCNFGGDRGVLWSTPRGACAATGLPFGQNFFSIIDGKPNFDPKLNLADALACVAVQDDVGCQFPHPLASVLRALGLDGMAAPPENAGFLRPGAFLSIILLTNQDDCSAPAGSFLFSSDSQVVSDMLGPLTSFRCAEYGLLCDGVPPPRTKAGKLSNCQSAEDGMLEKISDVVASLKTLKADPNMLLVAALAGPAEPVTVQLGPPGVSFDPSPWPSLAPSCASPDGVTARPGVRIEQWVYAFGHNGVLATPCDDSYASSLQSIAQSIAAVIGPPCLDARIATTAGPHGPRPDCTVTDYSNGAQTGTPIPSCVDAGDVGPCWTLTNAAACPGGKLLGFQSPANGLDSSVQCTVCSDPRDPRCPDHI